MFETSLSFCGWLCPAPKTELIPFPAKTGKEYCPASEHWEKEDGFQHEGELFAFNERITYPS
jgi:hypothetical protein